MPRAFVTGSTGFVGKNLIEELLAQNWHITALCRLTSDVSYLQGLPVNIVKGDITDIASLQESIPKNVDAVFHLAGNTSRWSRLNYEQERVNVIGTRNVVETALRRRANHLIMTSSIAAYGIQEGELSESTPSKAASSWINYQRTKWLAEEEVRKGVRLGLRATIMNPGAIMGPYDTKGWGQLFSLVDNGSGRRAFPGQISVGHVREIARAHVTALNCRGTGENYILAGTEATFLEIFTYICELLGKPPPVGTLSLAGLRLSAWRQVVFASISARRPRITPETVALFGKKVICPSHKAQKELGYKIVPIRDILRDCYDWLTSENSVRY